MKSIWTPRYKITSSISRALMAIEAAKAIVDHTPLPLALEEALRRQARLRSTHYSTAIEGNRLTLAQVEQVIQKNKHFAAGYATILDRQHRDSDIDEHGHDARDQEQIDIERIHLSCHGRGLIGPQW